MKKKLILLLGASALLVQSLMAQTTLSLYLGHDAASPGRDYATSLLTNFVAVYDADYNSNTVVTDAVASSYLSLDFGGGITATWSVVGNYGGAGSGNTRIQGDGLNNTDAGPTGSNIFTLETLTGVTSLNLDYISLTSFNAVDDANITLDGNLITNNSGPVSAVWSLGQVLVVANSDINADTFNTSGFTVTAVPEPATYALLFGLAGLGLVLVRRRRRA